MKSVHELWKEKEANNWDDTKFKEELIKHGHIHKEKHVYQDLDDETIERFSTRNKDEYPTWGLRKE